MFLQLTHHLVMLMNAFSSYVSSLLIKWKLLITKWFERILTRVSRMLRICSNQVPSLQPSTLHCHWIKTSSLFSTGRRWKNERKMLQFHGSSFLFVLKYKFILKTNGDKNKSEPFPRTAIKVLNDLPGNYEIHSESSNKRTDSILCEIFMKQ